MNWILRKSDKFDYHTNLTVIVRPIIDDLQNLNWLISDLEYISWVDYDLPVNMDDDYLILSSEQFNQLANADMQIIWGVLLGIPKDVPLHIDEEHIPFAEYNGLVWKNGNLQHPDAQVEIVCFDSGYTMVKFTDEALSAKFKTYFPEAIELEKFKNKSAPNY